ncbi:hypothetical protein [Pseudoroseomonas cervicalis]|uniref:hypothetical protein n=1 Tax=Teichococcus cervicalis TaxID=204525 RepID=UPI00277D7F2E|nr:hypothetical protein [Pseudoroseomonas cervicalis]MDQ1081736.1 hypothetical protein [Pseudoroseomonas cervicalis]
MPLPSDRDTPRRAGPWLLRLAALLPALGFLAVVLAPPLNPDVAAVLDFASRMRAGEVLYVDLIDINPPLIFLLNWPAAWLASVTPLDPPQALVLTLLLLCALCWWLCHALRDREAGPAERAVMAAMLPLLPLSAGQDFGQREQIMALLALPYLLLAERRILGRATPAALVAAVTLLAGIGFALKPHFLAIPALVEAVVLLARIRRQGWARPLLDPVPWGMAALWLAYLALIHFVFPAYFENIVPLVRDWYLDLGGAPWWAVLLTAPTGSAAVLALGLAPLAARAPTGWLPRLAAAAALGALAAALVQHKGWSYHLVPVWIFGGLAGAAMLARGLDGTLPQATLRRAAPLLAIGVAFGFTLFTLRGGEAPWVALRYATSPGGLLADWLEREAPGQRLLVLSPDIPTVFPAVTYAESRWISPFMSTWLLQAVYRDCPAGGARYRDPAQMGAAEALVWRSLTERFLRLRPSAVVVSRNTGIADCNGQRFDFIEYFRRNPLFARAWEQYRLKGEIAGYMLYEREE